jgi:protoporphyrin/coproporphyrin ferrochelatase
MLGTRRYLGNSPAHAVSGSDAAVLLINLGTPQAPDAASVRRYLAQFLADPRVIETPRWLWWLILNGVILRIRPPRSARAYAKIWTAAGSPLMVNSRALAERLERRLAQLCTKPIQVRLAMSYGEPSVAKVLAELNAAGVRRLLVLPLYPQYSASSTGAALDAVATTLMDLRWPPEMRFINDYYNEPKYIDALAASVRSYWQEHGRGERLLLSFHGLPERYVRAGDPYLDQCRASAERLQSRLDLPANAAEVCFQSRVGREPWLKPYTDLRLQELGAAGVRHVQVLCPGFAVDCLETLEEIAMQNKELFIESGGQRLDYIPALNASADHADALATLLLRHGRGWPEFEACTAGTP